MSTSEDVTRLYSRFGGNASTYQEVVMERQIGLAAGKWAMLGQVNLGRAPEVPLVDRRIHPAMVQQTLGSKVETIHVATPELGGMRFNPEPAIEVEQEQFVAPVVQAPTEIKVATPTLRTVTPSAVQVALAAMSVQPATAKASAAAVVHEELSPPAAPAPVVSSIAAPPFLSVPTEPAPVPQSQAYVQPQVVKPPVVAPVAPAPAPAFAVAGTRPAAPVAAIENQGVRRSRAEPRSGAPSTTHQSTTPPTPAPKRTRTKPLATTTAVATREDLSLAGVFNRLASQSNSHPAKKGVLRKRFDT